MVTHTSSHTYIGTRLGYLDPTVYCVEPSTLVCHGAGSRGGGGTLLCLVQYHPRSQSKCGQAVKVVFLAWSRDLGTLQSFNFRSRQTTWKLNEGCGRPSHKKSKGSRPKFGHGQAVKANFGRSKFLTTVADSTVQGIVVSPPCGLSSQSYELNHFCLLRATV